MLWLSDMATENHDDLPTNFMVIERRGNVHPMMDHYVTQCHHQYIMISMITITLLEYDCYDRYDHVHGSSVLPPFSLLNMFLLVIQP